MLLLLLLLLLMLLLLSISDEGALMVLIVCLPSFFFTLRLQNGHRSPVGAEEFRNSLTTALPKNSGAESKRVHPPPLSFSISQKKNEKKMKPTF